MRKDGKIHLPAKRQKYAENWQPVRISAGSYNALVDFCNET